MKCPCCFEFPASGLGGLVSSCLNWVLSAESAENYARISGLLLISYGLVELARPLYNASSSECKTLFPLRSVRQEWARGSITEVRILAWTHPIFVGLPFPSLAAPRLSV